MLEVKGLCAGFGPIKVVHDVSFSVKPASITGLIGPNGAGKTTLFNALCGVIRPTDGQIAYKGRRLDGLRPDQIFAAGVARTFQLPRPFATLTVLENLMLALPGQPGETHWRNWLAPRAVRAVERRNRERAMELLSFVTLTHLADRPASVLSGGQLKLLELGRALMGDPSIVLLDEPAAGVNPALLDVIVERLHRMRDDGITVLVIEHNMEFVMRNCAQIVVMAQGRLILEGSPDQIASNQQVIDAYLGEAA